MRVAAFFHVVAPSGRGDEAWENLFRRRRINRHESAAVR